MMDELAARAHRLTVRAHRLADKAHLAYLGALPALATLAALWRYGSPVPMLIFLGGVALVGVYLGVVISYTPPTRSLRLALLALLDGPVWLALSPAADVTPTSLAVENFLIDGAAIWLVIVWLAVSTDRPTREQRIATIGLTLAALGVLALLFAPYVREQLWGNWWRIGWVFVGFVEAAVVRYKVLEADHVLRGEDTSAFFIVLWIMVWVGAMIAGMILHETA